ncbi:MAG: isochorismatase family protein [Planctomycetaceae bacterium]|nr:isochorismatase family protein [Planctomycetaceae bacterium]
MLIVDPLKARCNLLDAVHSAMVRKQFAMLDDASNIVGVPRFFAVSEAKDIRSDWLSRPCEKSRKRIYDFSADCAPWSNTNLVEAIKTEKRERLFICGFWLDSTVSATALDAYVDGFDVHLVSDVAPARNAIQGKSALERLLQIGVVPISTQQLLYEWMTKTPDITERENLLQLIGNSP